MLGLTFEKLFVVAVLAAVLIGPSRLPAHAHRLAELVRSARRVADRGRAAMRDDLGVPLDSSAWPSFDPREYDPRRIVRDAWNAGPAPADERAAEVQRQAASVRPGQQHVVTDSAAHPRRVRIASLAADDPRRVAAQTPTSRPASRSDDGGGTPSSP